MQVYLTLAMAMLAAAGGCYLSMATGIGMGGLLPLLLSLIGIPWLLSLPPTDENRTQRRALLAGVAAVQGAAIAPLSAVALAEAPEVLLTALVSTLGLFGALSAIAAFSPRRSLLLLGAPLAALVSGLFWAAALSSVFSAFGVGGARFPLAELLIGLVAFGGYVAYDTQVVIERAEAGFRDEVRAALELFSDAAAIFVRVLVLLLRNASERDDEAERRRRRRGAGRSRAGWR